MEKVSLMFDWSGELEANDGRAVTSFSHQGDETTIVTLHDGQPKYVWTSNGDQYRPGNGNVGKHFFVRNKLTNDKDLAKRVRQANTDYIGLVGELMSKGYIVQNDIGYILEKAQKIGRIYKTETKIVDI
jgi:hypothetical protein